MQNTTVAKRKLLDAVTCPNGDFDCEYNPGIYPRGWVFDENGDLVRYTRSGSVEPGNLQWVISMTTVTIDGHCRESQDNYGTYIFNIKDDEGGICQPNEEGFCRCQPRDYWPEPYHIGDICETCWIKYGVIYGTLCNCKRDEAS